MKKIFAALAILLVFSSSSAFSSDKLSRGERIMRDLRGKPLNYFFGAGFYNAVPQKEFYDNIKTSGQGFVLNGGFSAEPAPLDVGAEIGFLFFRTTERYFNYGPGNWNLYRDTVTTNNFAIPLLFYFRIRPNFKRLFYPYFEAIAGPSFLIASASYQSATGASDTKNRTSVAFNYGLGGGLMFKLVDFFNLPSSFSQLLFDVKIRYLYGTKTKYYNVRILDDTSAEFSEFKANADMIVFSAGAAFLF